jgi:AraC family transcriptional regulator
MLARGSITPYTRGIVNVSIWNPGAFAGQTQSREIAGVLLSEVRHERPLSVAPHSHAAPYFSLLLEGSYSESAVDFSVRYEPYTVVFHDPLTEHSDTIAPGGCRMFFVELLSPWAEIVATIEKPAHLFEMDGSAPTWLVLGLHREFLCGDAASPLTVESILHELCVYLSDSNVDADREPDWLAAIDDLLRERASSPIDLHAIARQLGVNPSHLCRTFRRFRRRTIGDYVVGLRVQLVCRMLSETRDSLSDIAEFAGFTDQSHMTRTFKRTTGATPGAYRHESGLGAAPLPGTGLPTSATRSDTAPP